MTVFPYSFCRQGQLKFRNQSSSGMKTQVSVASGIHAFLSRNMNHRLRIIFCKNVTEKALNGLLLNEDFKRLFKYEGRTTVAYASNCSLNIVIFYYFHNVVVYLVFVSLKGHCRENFAVLDLFFAKIITLRL